MASIVPGYEYDIFISYRQKDNKHEGWVTEFVSNLKGELESTFKEEISVYFDINPHDGLLETHDVNASLKEKLKCLIFIPVISQTYCDSKSFAWQHEFVVFNKMAKEDQFGRDIRLTSGNVTSRILPVKIHDLDLEDKTLLENELGGVLRGIEFIFKSSGVNRPLKQNDERAENLNHTYYRDQINKVANAVKEIITAIKKHNQQGGEVPKEVVKSKAVLSKTLKPKIIIVSAIMLALLVLGYFIIHKLSDSSKQVEKSIAVLPFINDSQNDSTIYFMNGVMDEILNNLQKISDFSRVLPRTSVEQFRGGTGPSIPEIAKKLNVNYIVQGSGQKYGNKFVLRVQLIAAHNEKQLWGKPYKQEIHETSDMINIESQIAQSIAAELKATITPEEKQRIEKTPTTNLTAYDFYLKGNDYYSKDENSLALDMYSKAIQEDTLFTAAYAQRAIVHLYFYWEKLDGWEGHDLKAKEDIKKGNQLNPELPELKLAKAVAYFYLDRDYDNALKILKELKKEAPNMADMYTWSSYILRRQGKLEESIIEAKHGIKMDPFNPEYIDNLSQTYELLHQYDKAIELSRQGLSLIPDYKNFNRSIFSSFLNKTGDLRAALKESGLKEEDFQYKVYYYTRQYDKLIELISKNTSILTDQFSYQPKIYELALTYYLSGKKSLCKIYADSSITILKEKLKELPNDDRLFAALGKSYAFIGNAKEAIVCGKKAVNLMPIKLDAYQGVNKEQDLMEIYIFTGNYDLALDKIEYLLSISSWLSVGILMVDPVFDNLRSLPRFQKIIEHAQKQIL
jgi:TolB-like protein